MILDEGNSTKTAYPLKNTSLTHRLEELNSCGFKSHGLQINHIAPGPITPIALGMFVDPVSLSSLGSITTAYLINYQLLEFLKVICTQTVVMLHYF